MQADIKKPFDTKAKALGCDYLAPDGSEIQELVGMSGGGLAHCRRQLQYAPEVYGKLVRKGHYGSVLGPCPMIGVRSRVKEQ